MNQTPAVNRSANRAVGVTVGTVYLVLGLIGLFVPSGGFFARHGEGGLIFGLLETNPFHNLLYMLLGAAWLVAASSTVSAAQSVNRRAGILLLIVGGLGVVLIDSDLNIIAANQADNLFHLLTAALTLVIGFVAERDARRAGI